MATERFDLFRLSLLARRQRDAFGQPDPAKDPSREEYLRTVLSDRWTFSFYGTEFHYVPEAEQAPGDAIMGRIGRPVAVSENRPPDEGLADTVHEGWKAAAVLVDPSEHADGQKAAVGVDRKVGTPTGLIGALVDAINEARPHSPYAISVEPISNAQSFWQFAENNKGQITSLTFDLVPPNMFGGSDDLSEELRGFRKKENAERVTIALASKDGLDTDTDRTREAVDYASKGAGRIRARTKQGRRFNSTSKAASTTLDASELPDEASFSRLARLAQRILGRE